MGIARGTVIPRGSLIRMQFEVKSHFECNELFVLLDDANVCGSGEFIHTHTRWSVGEKGILSRRGINEFSFYFYDYEFEVLE
jgi:hypothetical protein